MATLAPEEASSWGARLCRLIHVAPRCIQGARVTPVYNEVGNVFRGPAADPRSQSDEARPEVRLDLALESAGQPATKRGISCARMLAFRRDGSTLPWSRLVRPAPYWNSKTAIRSRSPDMHSSRDSCGPGKPHRRQVPSGMASAALTTLGPGLRWNVASIGSHCNAKLLAQQRHPAFVVQ